MQQKILFKMLIISQLCLVGIARAQRWKDYKISPNGDTLNRVDQHDKKWGAWVNHVDELRGEPGYEEEGFYKNDRKEGTWRLYTLQGDLYGVELYKWGNKDGVSQYFAINGALLREESWRALNPDKQYDTITIEDIDHLNQYKTVVVKNEGVGLKDGEWKYYDPSTGMVARTEVYTLGKKEASKSTTASTAAAAPKAGAKPKEVLDFEKKAGKKKVKVQNGSTF